MNALELLSGHIKSVHPLDDAVLQEMLPAWHLIDVKRKEVLTRVGDVEKYLYYVVEGVQRAYIPSADKDATLVISYTGSFSGIIDRFFTETPARYSLEALTAGRMMRIHYLDFHRLLQKHYELETWVRVAITYALAGTLERNAELLTLNAEQRFVKVLKRSPQILNMIPHKYIASYIGVDPTTFSKMLGSVRL